MNLRVFTRIPVPAMVLNARKIFSGEFQHPGLLDFEAERVEMSFDRPVPFQVGGDAEGYRDEPDARHRAAQRGAARLQDTAAPHPPGPGHPTAGSPPARRAETARPSTG